MLTVYSWGSTQPDTFASLDPDCLCLLNYLRLADVECQVAYCNDPALSPDGVLPFIRDDDVVISGLPRIMQYLIKQARITDLDQPLDPRQQIESDGFVALAGDDLRDLLWYTWYYETGNYVDAIRPEWARLVGFPRSLLVPNRWRGQALERLECRRHLSELGSETNSTNRTNSSAIESIPEVVKRLRTPVRVAKPGVEKLRALAGEVFALLTKKLGDHPFLFGSTPSKADVFIYSYLTLLQFNHKFRDTFISHQLETEHAALGAYVERLRTKLEQASEPVEISVAPRSLAEVALHFGMATVHTVATLPGVHQVVGLVQSIVASEDTDASAQESSDLDTRRANIYYTVGVGAFFTAFLIRGGFLDGMNQSTFLRPTVPHDMVGADGEPLMDEGE
ncbi:hypothetical protein IWQ60_012274 [Tieghemiomyces parasiticus]|uniref:Mitochondrial outer membrane transport complex Sam37/metaxin N-terminal domain-containing protein n=1 Tax=Tieghemiomyces parasiticus TaxID=78921 RepID=A0A9W7ZMH8_9FUNG|nr:hypothetical protein IWQ60_012274 [Tieghemiomyces parasiticus]